MSEENTQKVAELKVEVSGGGKNAPANAQTPAKASAKPAEKKAKKKKFYAPLMSEKKPNFVKPVISWTILAVELAAAILIGLLVCKAAGNI